MAYHIPCVGGIVNIADGTDGDLAWIQAFAKGKGLEVSVSPNGAGWNTYRVSDGALVDMSNDLIEVENFLWGIYDIKEVC